MLEFCSLIWTQEPLPSPTIDYGQFGLEIFDNPSKLVLVTTPICVNARLISILVSDQCLASDFVDGSGLKLVLSKSFHRALYLKSGGKRQKFQIIV